MTHYTNMKANQFYRQWITDYRKEKNDKSGEPIQDGDLLDWLAEKFESGEFKQLNKPVVMQGCQCKDRIGETTVWCCNQCGLPCENGWLPTHKPIQQATVGQRSVGTVAESQDFYCADWNRCGAICEAQCPRCKKAETCEAPSDGQP